MIAIGFAREDVPIEDPASHAPKLNSILQEFV
jgi:hypothetical protein